MLSIARCLVFSSQTVKIMKRTYDNATNVTVSKRFNVQRINKKLIKISTNPEEAKQIAVEKLKKGEVIAIPTDTVYGLTCSANASEAIHRLYNIKGRHELKPVAICVASIEDLRLWGETRHLNDSLLKELLPGAVTIVVKRSPKLNKMLNPGVSNIGIRITENSFIQDVCKAFNEPIALTSANKSSSKSTLKVHEFKDLWPHLGAVFNGGPLGLSEEQRAASTVIDLSAPGHYKIIRFGVSGERIIKIVEKHNISLYSHSSNRNNSMHD